MIFPFFAALAHGFQTITDKYGLSKRHIPIRTYVPFLFLYLFFFSALATPFLGHVNWDLLLAPQFLFLFLLLIILAITWNIFYYESLQKEKLYEFETIIILAPLVTILLSWIFFPDQWNLRVGAAAIVAALALVWSHWEKHHFTLNHYSLNLLVAVLLWATEDVIAAQLLKDNVIAPVSLYAIRTLFLFAFFFAYYRPETHRNRGSLNIISLSGLLGALYFILKYYGYQRLGIPYTALVTLAGPMSVYIGSATVIHERMKPKVVISAAIIAAAIVYATYVLAVK